MEEETTLGPQYRPGRQFQEMFHRYNYNPGDMSPTSWSHLASSW